MGVGMISVLLLFSQTLSLLDSICIKVTYVSEFGFLLLQVSSELSKRKTPEDWNLHEEAWCRPEHRDPLWG